MKIVNSINRSRRKFISSCAACGACMAVTPSTFLHPSLSPEKSNKLRIKIVYALPGLELPKGGWPYIGFNFEREMDKFNSVLKNNFPDFEFLQAMAAGPEDGEKILSQEKNEKIGGYIVFQMSGKSTVAPTIVKSDKPILYVNYLYGGAGKFRIHTASFIRAKEPGVGFVCSSEIDDLIAAVKSFKIIDKGGSLDDFVRSVSSSRKNLTPPPGNLDCRTDEISVLSIDEWKQKIAGSRILAVKGQNSGPSDPVMGIQLEYISFDELNCAWQSADKDESLMIANKWNNSADEIIDVSYGTLVNSASMYVGMKSLLKTHEANAIAINCLRGFYSGHLHAYPCLGFHELNNEGLVGACECDIRSAATMLAFTTLTGRPGYISDPVVDTAKRQIIYAHCVAPNKMFGPNGPTNPFSIMTHSEDKQGAAVRSILPEGYLTTTLEINNKRKEIILHQAKAIGNSDDDRACRTKLCAEPIGDIEKLFTMNDQWGWHRVTFYGDLKQPAYEIAEVLGWKVVEET